VNAYIITLLTTNLNCLVQKKKKEKKEKNGKSRDDGNISFSFSL